MVAPNLDGFRSAPRSRHGNALGKRSAKDPGCVKNFAGHLMKCFVEEPRAHCFRNRSTTMWRRITRCGRRVRRWVLTQPGTIASVGPELIYFRFTLTSRPSPRRTVLRIWATSGSTPLSETFASRCSPQLRAEVAGNQVEEEVGGDASGASMFRHCSPRARLCLPDQGEQP